MEAPEGWDKDSSTNLGNNSGMRIRNAYRFLLSLQSIAAAVDSIHPAQDSVFQPFTLPIWSDTAPLQAQSSKGGSDEESDEVSKDIPNA